MALWHWHCENKINMTSAGKYVTQNSTSDQVYLYTPLLHQRRGGGWGAKGESEKIWTNLRKNIGWLALNFYVHYYYYFSSSRYPTLQITWCKT